MRSFITRSLKRYHTNISRFFLFSSSVYRHVCIYITRDCTVKKKISMIVCDKFDEVFACIERVRSQIDLLTVYIILLKGHFVKLLPWDDIYHAYNIIY
jgi:hypothetical protein